MKLSKGESLNQIKRVIINKKNDVITALQSSYVEVPENISNNELFNVVMKTLVKGNGYFVYHLTQVISDGEVPETSNADGAGWNAASQISTGLFAWMQNKNNLEIAQIQADSADSQNQAALELAKIQEQIQQDKLRSTSSGGGDGGKDNSTIIIVGIIGAVLLIGTISTIVLIKKM